MAAENWAAKFLTNPITTNLADDLLYFARSPYGITNDAVINWQNFSAQFVGASVLTTKGDLLSFSTENSRLPVGSTDRQILQVASDAATGLAWSTTTYPTTNAVNTLLYASSANLMASLATANNGVLVTSAGGIPSISTTLPAGLTIPGFDSSTWVDETGASVAMLTNHGYTSDDGATRITFTLPTASAIGDFVEVNGKGSGLWTIVYTTNQQINFGSLPTTLSSGSLSSTNQYDCVRLRCLTANLIWTVVSVQGNLTVV